MGKSSKMAKTAISHKDLKKNNEERRKMMTQKMDESKTIFKKNKDTTEGMSLFPKSESKYKSDLNKHLDYSKYWEWLI